MTKCKFKFKLTLHATFEGTAEAERSMTTIYIYIFFLQSNIASVYQMEALWRLMCQLLSRLLSCLGLKDNKRQYSLPERRADESRNERGGGERVVICG